MVVIFFPATAETGVTPPGVITTTTTTTNTTTNRGKVLE